MPLEVVAIDGSTLSKFKKRYERGDNSALTSPRESTVEEANGRDDIDWLRGLRNNFGNKQLFEELRRVARFIKSVLTTGLEIGSSNRRHEWSRFREWL